MSQQDLVNEMYSEIKNAIGTLVDDRVYNLVAPQDYALPLITFSIVADSPLPFMGPDNLYIIDVDVQVNIFGHKSDGAAALRNINDTLIDYLHGFEIESIGTVSNTLRGITEMNTDNDIISIRSEYRVA